MKLTDREVDTVARRGLWYLDVYFGSAVERQDSVVYTGQGVADLDRTINLMTHTGSYPGHRFLCDVGFNFSVYRNFDLEDLHRIRAAYIAIHGNVDRIDAYRNDPAKAIQL